MRISKTPAFFEAIANDPQVFPYISQTWDGPVDLSQVWPDCIGIEHQDGGWVFMQIGDTTFEAHTFFKRRPRDNVRGAMRLTWAFMFCGTECEQIVTRVPDDLKHVKRLADFIGFKERFARENAWMRPTGLVGLRFYGMTLDDFVSSSPELEALGADFHSRLEAAGLGPNHDHDPVHDRYVGFLMACAKYHNLGKGVRIYNEWARFSQYGTIEVDENDVISFDDVRISFDANATPVITQASVPAGG